MDEKNRNMLVRALTGTIFVAVVLGAMTSGATFAALLVVMGVLCVVEFWKLSQGWLRALGVTYIIGCMVALWYFPVLGSGMSSTPAGVWDWRVAPAFMIVVWANDIFAYLVGMNWGHRQIFSHVSPNKSWEGFWGGVVGATIVATVIGRFWITGAPHIWIPFGVVVALSAVAGDLAESWFKRRAGVKDSGRLLPGHGGLLDRFDATLGAIPVAFLFFLVTYLTR